jgi:hypothetical protein
MKILDVSQALFQMYGGVSCRITKYETVVTNPFKAQFNYFFRTENCHYFCPLANKREK